MDFAFKGLKGFAAEAATALNRAVQVSDLKRNSISYLFRFYNLIFDVTFKVHRRETWTQRKD